MVDKSTLSPLFTIGILVGVWFLYLQITALHSRLCHKYQHSSLKINGLASFFSSTPIFFYLIPSTVCLAKTKTKSHRRIEIKMAWFDFSNAYEQQWLCHCVKFWMPIKFWKNQIIYNLVLVFSIGRNQLTFQSGKMRQFMCADARLIYSRNCQKNFLPILHFKKPQPCIYDTWLSTEKIIRRWSCCVQVPTVLPTRSELDYLLLSRSHVIFWL